MKKFLPFSRRRPSLDRYAINKGWSATDKCNVKSIRRISATSLNTKSIQVVRGAYNIDLNKVDSSFTKLHKACLLNDETQVIKQLNKVDNNSQDSSKRYPIHLATVNGNDHIVQLLIDNHADPNVQDNEDNTPLIKSIECGHEHLVKFLLDNDADPNISDLDKNTALHWAFMTESMIAIEALLKSKKCDLSLRNNKEETPLHLAVRSPMVTFSMFESMLHDGCDVNATDQLGLTAYDLARACNNQLAIRALNNFTGNKNVDDDDDDNNHDDHEKPLGPMKMCEEYKMQYITKNLENLEYEKRLIQLNAEIERLKLDMTFMREQNEKLEKDLDELSKENFKLKSDNFKLVEQINKSKQNENFNLSFDNFPNKSNSKSNEYNNESEIDSVECKSQEEFINTKACLQDRINKLKFGFTAT